MNTFKLGVAQLTSVDDVRPNLKQIEKLYLEAVNKDADLAVFPENSLFLRIRSGAGIEGLNLAGSEAAHLDKLVAKNGTPLMLTTPVAAAGGKAHNSTILFQRGMPSRVLYTKIHLFDVDVVGAPPVRESDGFHRGIEPAVVEIGGWKFGLSICYDLRFSELYARYAQKVDVILIPSAFLVPTGEAHWHVLVRARAIETQCFVAAPAQSGDHVSVQGGPGRPTYGHSLVVDPWGKIITELTRGPEMCGRLELASPKPAGERPILHDSLEAPAQSPRHLPAHPP